jgi:IMP dehydrogenase
MNKIEQLGLTFDDVLLKPGYVDFVREQVSLDTNLSRNIHLQIPFVSSPMDRVTDARMAIAMARLGGIGIIHCNMSIEDQAQEVALVRTEGLLVGAAISSHPGFERRVKLLIKAGASVLLIDSAHGCSKWVVETIKTMKKMWPAIDVIAGSVASYETAGRLISAGADGLRVGMGPGSICTTRIVSGMGVPQITAIMDVARAVSEMSYKNEKFNIPIIADGGIRTSGDVVKALAAGADTVMLGSLFGGCAEAPGEHHILHADQVPSRFKSILNDSQKDYLFKEYRGMGSIGAMKDGQAARTEGEFHGKNADDMKIMVAEGVEGLVPVTGSVKDLIDQMLGGIRSGFYYTGNFSIDRLHSHAKFIQVTHASLIESHPHDILIMK